MSIFCRRQVVSLLVALLVSVMVTGCSREVETAVVEISNSELPESPLEEASIALQTNQLDRAESILQAQLIRQPDDLSAGVLMSHLLVRRQQFSAAIELLDRLAATNPDQSDACEAEAAEVAVLAGDSKDAINRFKAIVRRKPGFVSARRRLAEIFNSQGFRFDANEVMRGVAAEQPLSMRDLISLINPMRPFSTFTEKPDIDNADHLSRYGVLGVVSALRSRSDFGEAIECLSESELLASGDPAATAMMGLLWAETNQFDSLRRWASGTSIRSDELRRYPAYWLAMGALAMHDRDDSAAACFVEACRREPGCVEAWTGLIAALQLKGNQSAADKARKTSRLVEESAWLSQHLATDQAGNVEMLQRLVEVLNELGRWVESVAWQEMWVANSAPGSIQLKTLSEYKQKLLQQYPSGRNDSAVIGGLVPQDFGSAEPWFVKVASWDRKELDSLQGSASDHESSAPSGFEHPVFVGVAQSLGLDFLHRNATVPVQREFRLFQPLGGGVACLDFDLDGQVDFYFCQAATDPPGGVSQHSNRIFRQVDGRFLDQTIASETTDNHYSMGVTAGDVNQDGFADLVVGNIGVNVCLVNQGDGTFRPVPVQDDTWQHPMLSMSVAIADLTGDGLPEIAEVNYVDDPRVFDPIQRDAQGKAMRLPGPLHFDPAPQRVFVSQGNGQYRGHSMPSDENAQLSTGMGVLVADLDSDGRNELFIGCDQKANQVWKFDSSAPDDRAAWSDAAVAMGLAYGPGGKPKACMGIAAADFDHNGRLDLHITNFYDEWSNQYMQNASGVFVDAAVAMGIDDVSARMLGFGVQAFDFDNNSTWDLAIGNGHIEDFRNKRQKFKMRTQVLTMVNQKYVAIVPKGDDDYWNTDRLGRAVAKCDWNRDGRTDLVTTEVNGPAELLENRTTTQNHFLQIELVGTHAERDAIGAIVTVVAGDRTWTQFCQAGDGYLCKNEPLMSFGVGSINRLDRIDVSWPSGKSQTFPDPPVDTRVLLIEGSGQIWNHESSAARQPKIQDQ
ncbi:ASPIC and UnbV [Rubripirellula reticaptiva]|uniref:ASPIC and UnbV n=1 Tax=Rubripirellula reticaptiva TaxID=2528013 RepID=A0A5C6FC76_9BACT|nr:ASPIC and UnbV [Rubripirellula reticaptiva]